MDQAKVDLLERAAAIPPGVIGGASLFGVPVSDLTGWLMLVYAVLLIAWHLKSKWFAPKGQKGEL